MSTEYWFLVTVFYKVIPVIYDLKLFSRQDRLLFKFYFDHSLGEGGVSLPGEIPEWWDIFFITFSQKSSYSAEWQPFVSWGNNWMANFLLVKFLILWFISTKLVYKHNIQRHSWKIHNYMQIYTCIFFIYTLFL